MESGHGEESLGRIADRIRRKRGWGLACSCAAALAAGYLGSAMWAAGAQDGSPEELQARRFVVTDGAGQRRAELGVQPDGEVRLTVRGKGKEAAYIGVDRKGTPLIALAGAAGEPVLELGVMQNNPVAVLRDDQQRRRVGITVGKGGAAGMVLYDARGRERCSVSVDARGQPQVKLSDPQGTPLATLLLTDDAGAGLDLADAAGRVRVSVQVDKDGNATLALLHADGRIAWKAPNRE